MIKPGNWKMKVVPKIVQISGLSARISCYGARRVQEIEKRGSREQASSPHVKTRGPRTNQVSARDGVNCHSHQWFGCLIFLLGSVASLLMTFPLWMTEVQFYLDRRLK